MLRKLKVSSCVNQVDVDNSVTFGLNSLQTKKEKDSNSSTTSSVESVPREYIPAVEAGIRDSLDNGVIAGYPLIDIKARLFDGSYHDVDSNEMAFKIAASMALKNAVSKVNPVILEPMMKVEVHHS